MAVAEDILGQRGVLGGVSEWEGDMSILLLEVGATRTSMMVAEGLGASSERSNLERPG